MKIGAILFLFSCLFALNLPAHAKKPSLGGLQTKVCNCKNNGYGDKLLHMDGTFVQEFTGYGCGQKLLDLAQAGICTMPICTIWASDYLLVDDSRAYYIGDMGPWNVRVEFAMSLANAGKCFFADPRPKTPPPRTDVRAN